MSGNMLVNKYMKARNNLEFARNVFNFKASHKTNYLTGRILPAIKPIKVMPGDTFNLSFSSVIRSATLVAPVLDDLYVDVLAFWVPNRLVMADFAQFLGENDSYAWTLKTNVKEPYITSLESVGSTSNMSMAYVADHYRMLHFGIRPKDLNNIPAYFADSGLMSTGISVLRSRGYDLIYNEWWRDENIIDPVLFSKDSGKNLALDVALYRRCLGSLLKAARLSDMFNKCLPAPQRADSVSLDLGDLAPVVVVPEDPDEFTNGFTSLSILGDGSNSYNLENEGGPAALVSWAGGTADQLTNAAVYADLSNVSAFTINQLRYAIMLQRFYEISARGGMREVEFYQAQFGVVSSDARFTRSELLTQKRFRINITQVLSNAETSDSGSILSHLGDTGAYSLTGIKGHLFRKTFTEFGHIHIQLVIREQPSIAFGYDRDNFQLNLLDHYLPVFDHIGEQAHYMAEINPDGTGILGYNEAWAEYRYQVSDVVGILAPGQPLEYWTLARDTSSIQGLTQAFIEQDFKEFDRALVYPVAYGDSGVDADGVPYDSDRYQWLIDFYVVGKMARTMSKDSTPGLLGRI